MVDEIEAYLRSEHAPFSYGMELLEKAFGNTGNLSRYKYASFIPGNAKKELRLQLSKALKFLSATYSSKESTEIEQALADQGEGNPRKITQAKQELKRIYKRSSFVHASMVQEAFGDARQEYLFKYAKEMMEEIQPAINHFTEIVRTYEKSGEVIGASSIEADRAIELSKKINSLRSSISRYKRLERDENDELKKAYYARQKADRKSKLKDLLVQLDNV